ncbi:hypothetical protein ElyMa_006564500 [Elysia marginata]|uniref:Uncharacterized protein n=1 Tax=Elysia marginata TaxID=1093978 RepID=A0AAV4ICM4_9GAST|nr:hypothetical protein ElyMa_006564500 [Elysia marginata]
MPGFRNTVSDFPLKADLKLIPFYCAVVMTREPKQKFYPHPSGGLDSSFGSGFAPWPRGRGFETQPSTVRAPTGWAGVSIM